MSELQMGIVESKFADIIWRTAPVTSSQLLKKAPRWITCLLWAMVAVRLVCPISLQSPVSAYQVAAPTAVQKSGQVEYFHYVYESGDKPSIQLDVDAIRPAEAIPAQPQTTPEQSAAAEPVQETAGRSDPTAAGDGVAGGGRRAAAVRSGQYAAAAPSCAGGHAPAG